MDFAFRRAVSQARRHGDLYFASLLCDVLLNAIVTHVVGDRPDRIEPRERKRRPKNYKFMTEPRQTFKRLAA